MAISKLKFKILNKNKLVEHLKKNSNVESNLLLQIKVDDYIRSKNSDSDRSVIKNITNEFSSIFQLTDGQQVPDNVLFVGIYNTPRIINILSLMEDNDTFILEYKDKVKNITDKLGNDISFIEVDKIIIENSKLQFEIDCANFELFEFLSDEVFDSIITGAPFCVQFNFSLDERKNIFNVMGFDENSELAAITYNTKGVMFSGKDWKYKYVPADFQNLNQCKDKITIKKKNFKVIDSEVYEMSISQDFILFRSTESENIVVVGAVEDEPYE